MQITVSMVSTALFTAVFVRVWDQKNNDRLDLRYNSNITTVTPESSSSCSRYIKEYSEGVATKFINLKQKINKNCSTLQSNMNTCLEKCENELRDMKTVILGITSNCSRSIEEYSNETETNFINLKQEIDKNCSTLQNNVNTLQNNMSSCFEKYNNCKREISDIEMAHQRFENDTRLKFGKVEEGHKGNEDMLWYSLMSLGVCEVVLTIILVCCVRKVHVLKRQLDRQLGKGVLTPKPKNMDTKQMHSNQKVNEAGGLMRSIAVICFNETRIAFYRDLMGDITSDMETVYHRVSKKEDTLHIKSKIAVLFVERNDRHIILESEHEIGDLKVSCVRYIQQNGGHVIVVYCGHKESDNMGDLLCSPSLTSADRHRELRALKDDNCFLSIHKTFSQTQKNNLKTKLKEYIDSK